MLKFKIVEIYMIKRDVPMKNMFSWLILIFAVFFWIFRLVITYLTSIGIEMPFEIMNMTMEIAVLFISFICILLAFSRKLIGGIIYCISYVMYFGIDGIKQIINLVKNPTITSDSMNLLISLTALFLAIGVLSDLLFNKDRHESKDDKNTYWFYKNKKYDRQLDKRADKNQYRT